MKKLKHQVHQTGSDEYNSNTGPLQLPLLQGRRHELNLVLYNARTITERRLASRNTARAK